MKVVCEECKRSFEMTNDILKESHIGSLKTEVTYNCPNCNQKYIVGIMNAKARKLKKRMEELRIIISSKLSSGIRECKEQQEINELSIELQKEMNKYSKGGE